MQNDGVWRLSDEEWMTLITIEDDMVVATDGPWKKYLIGESFGDIQERVKNQHLELQRVE